MPYKVHICRILSTKKPLCFQFHKDCRIRSQEPYAELQKCIKRKKLNIHFRCTQYAAAFSFLMRKKKCKSFESSHSSHFCTLYLPLLQYFHRKKEERPDFALASGRDMLYSQILKGNEVTGRNDEKSQAISCCSQFCY